jgi:hypothetical protein
MQNRIGYNINCEAAGSDRQAAVNVQIALHSAATLLLNDHKSGWFFSKQIAALSPETLRICRTYMDGWDGNVNEAPDGNSTTGFLSPLNYVNFLENLHAPEGTIHQVMCEPDMHKDSQKDPQGNRLRANVHWQSEVAKEMSRRGMRGCFDNKQTVTFDQREIDAGFHDELWKTLSQLPEHFYGIHEYWLGDAWFNVSAHLMHYLEKNETIDLSVFIFQDGTNAELQRLYVNFPSEAHLGRCEIIAQRCRKLHISIPRMVVTELGCDYVRLEQLDAVTAINGRKPMGYPTMAHYWHVHYPSWSAAQTMVAFCKWLNRSMPDYIVAGCLFGKDTSFENGNYHMEGEVDRLLVEWAEGLQDSEPTDDTDNDPPPPDPVLDTAWRNEARALAEITRTGLREALETVERLIARLDSDDTRNR